MQPSSLVIEALARCPASRWASTPGDIAAGDLFPATSVIAAEEAKPIIADMTLWDLWPVQLDNGHVAPVAGGELWVVLSAERRDNPDARHDEARMRLFHRIKGEWRDCGNLLPDGFSPGSREWSGSTRLDQETGRVTLWFTAAGQRGQAKVDFEQRLFHATGKLDCSGPLPVIGEWSGLTQTAVNDGAHYVCLDVEQGVPGRIKGFRDPYWFRDPADGKGYIVFTGSKAGHASTSAYDGVIGIAMANDTDGLAPFTLLPPLIDGEGQVNELEVPHVIVHGGLYYLFWSSQARIFAPGSMEGPTGLYGMVAPSLFGPYEPLNGSGLVLANPPTEPFQAFAWKVTPSLEVASFVDYWGLEGRDIARDPALKAAHFGGTMAPMSRIALQGNTSRIVA
jgi:levansucrase